MRTSRPTIAATGDVRWIGNGVIDDGSGSANSITAISAKNGGVREYAAGMCVALTGASSGSSATSVGNAEASAPKNTP